MPFFIVKLRRTIEWEQMYEAETAAMAEDLAKLEAHNGTIVDEQIIVEDVEALDSAEVN